MESPDSKVSFVSKIWLKWSYMCLTALIINQNTVLIQKQPTESDLLANLKFVYKDS